MLDGNNPFGKIKTSTAGGQTILTAGGRLPPLHKYDFTIHNNDKYKFITKSNILG